MSQPIAVRPRCCVRIDALSRKCCKLTSASLDRRPHPAPGGAARALRVPIEPDSCGFADQILFGHEAPDTAVLAVVAVVAHHEVLPGRHVPAEYLRLGKHRG